MRTYIIEGNKLHFDIIQKICLLTGKPFLSLLRELLLDFVDSKIPEFYEQFIKKNKYPFSIPTSDFISTRYIQLLKNAQQDLYQRLMKSPQDSKLIKQYKDISGLLESEIKESK